MGNPITYEVGKEVGRKVYLVISSRIHDNGEREVDFSSTLTKSDAIKKAVKDWLETEFRPSILRQVL